MEAPKSTRPAPPMPGILYGTAWKKEATERLVATAVRLGFRGIDTACQPKHYNEPGVGAGIAAGLGAGTALRPGGQLTRADLFLQTKYTSVSGQDPERIPYDPKAPLAEQVAQSFAASLRNLRTDYLDSLVLHSPLPSVKQNQEVWRAMESLVAEGGVRQLGISNCYQLKQLQTLHDGARIKPSVVQNRFYADTSFDRDIRSFCRKHGMAYQSFWTLTANPEVLAHRTVSAIAAKYGRTAVQVFFRYLTHIGVTPLTGTSSEIHMRQDLAIFEFELTDAERKQMDGLF